MYQSHNERAVNRKCCTRSGKLHRYKRSLFMILIFVFLLLPITAEATVYKDHKKRVLELAKSIKTEINYGGSTLVEGIRVTAADQKAWNAAEKALRSGKYGDEYDIRFTRTFPDPLTALGYLDTIVGNKERYLELRNYATSVGAPYYIFAEATRENKYTIDYYINHKKDMYNRLSSIYKKELAPYKSSKLSVRIALAATCVANYFTYEYGNNALTNNLAYTIRTRRGVCADYAFMMDYLLRKMGLTTRLVSVYMKYTQSGQYVMHMINAMRINGRWFYIDTTNMDAGSYAIYKYDSNTFFVSELDFMFYPGWLVRSVY